MRPKPRPFFTFLTLILSLMLLLGGLPGGTRAQEGALLLPEGETAAESSDTQPSDTATEAAGDSQGDSGRADTLSTPEPIPASEALLVNDDFENGLGQWQGWQPDAAPQLVVDESGNSVVELLNGMALTPIQATALPDFKTTVWFNLRAAAADSESARGHGTLSITFGANYRLEISTLRTVLVDFSQPEVTLAGGFTTQTPETWHRLDLVYTAGTVTLTVNGMPSLTYSATAGRNGRGGGSSVSETAVALTPITLGNSGGGSVLVDDVQIIQLISVETPDTDTPPADTPAEDTPVLAYAASKLSGELVQLIESANVNSAAIAGDTGGNGRGTGSTSALVEPDEYGLLPDNKARLGVDIWAADGIAGEALVALVEAADGKVITVDFKRVSARLTLAGIAALSLVDEVSVIHLTPRLTASSLPAVDPVLSLNVSASLGNGRSTTPNANPRDPQSPTVSEGYDITGAQAWHSATYTGGGVRVAVIDVGFGGPDVAYNNDMACLPTTAITLEFGTRVNGDSTRGLSMLEVVCDVAPDSEIRLYKAQNTDELFDALVEAGNDSSDVIVIGVDLGPNVSPGDGTFGYSSAKNPYTALQSARDSGRVIVAAAGNSRQSYTTFDLTSGANVSMTITAPPGTPVNLGWNDWDDNQNGGAPREDFSAALSGGGFATLNKPARGSANPGYQFIIPTNCTASSGLCTTTLTISGLSGDTSTVQVQAGGLSSTITGVTGVTPFERSGSLARPADSANVIAVGAICASTQNNFPNLEYSSRGPVYLEGGDYTEILEGPFTGNQVKPEFVAPAQVATSQSFTTDVNTCNQGFAGTQAGASHVAGQVAVLLSNPNIDTFQQPGSPGELLTNILTYLRGHVFDLPFGLDANASGYDMRRGAGVPVLGSPTFDIDGQPNPNSFIVPNRIPAGECAGGLIYVGPYNVGASNMDGTITRPYNHLTQGIKVASEQPNRCVIALPGEYSAPLYVSDPTDTFNAVTVFSYASVLRTVVNPSTLYVVNSYTKTVGGFDKRGGLYVDDDDNFKFSGFEIIPGEVLNSTGTSPEPGVLVVDSAVGTQFTNNTIRGFTTRDLALVQIVDASQNVFIQGNRFVQNVNFVDPNDPTNRGSMTLIEVIDSGATTGRIFIDQNTFRNNESVVGLWSLTGLPDLPADGDQTTRTMAWMPLLRTIDSYTDITNNTFRDNRAETLIAAVTRLTVAPFETRILGNAIVNNEIVAEDLFSTGPLIHLFNMQRIYIVNNTIARNNLLYSGGDGFLIGRGDEILGNFNTGTPNNNNSGSLASEESAWEFHGNFIVDNLVDTVDDEGNITSTQSGASQVIGDLDASGVGCRNIAGTDNEGAKNNWLWRGASGIGSCSTAINTPANNNIITIDPFPRDEQYTPTGGVTYILGGPASARFNPPYYALTGSSNDSKPDGIDEGFDSFVTTVLPEFANGKDARGVNRRNDGDTDGTVAIDIGAYELTPLQLTTPIELTVNEDSGVIEVVLDQEYLTGGFPPYEVSFTRRPKYYGVNGQQGATCGAGFTTQAQGVAISFLTDGTPVLSYCPPLDFHTNTTDPDFVFSGVGFDFVLGDTSSATANSTVQFTINPTDDSLLATTLGDNSPAGDILDAPVGIGRTAEVNDVRLRPFVDFSENFVFSERNNTIEPSAQDQVDYTFTYGTLSLVNDPGNINPSYLVDNLVTLNAQQGKIGFDLSTDPEPSGGFAQAKFSYSVTDARGGNVTNIVTVRAVLPPGDFNLLTPADLSSFPQTSDVRIFTWEAATNTQNYRFLLERTSVSVPETVLELPTLTPGADTDQLTCAGTTCTLTLTDPQQALVTTGDYRWTVVANNEGVTTDAGNAPFTFSVNVGFNLLKNGSFEEPGATNQQAKNWKSGNIDDDKRTCNKIDRPGKPDKIVAYELNCAFQFKLLNGINSNISQKVEGFGKSGDELELSFYAEGKNLTNNASVSAKVKYLSGEKEKITVNIGTGTFDYQRFASEITLDGEAKNAKVKIEVKGGAGRTRVDAVRLVWETDSEFSLLTPVNADTFTSGADLTQFTWTLSAGATSYDIDVLLGAATVFSADGLSPESDSDALTCINRLCRYELNGAQQGALTGGLYTWQVTSNGGFTTPAANGPLSFNVDTGLANLAANSGFEQSNNQSLPQGWKVQNIGGSKTVCNKPSDNKYPSYQGICAFEFRGAPGYNGKLKQNADSTSVAVGNKLILTAMISGSGAVQDLGKVDAKVIFADGTATKLSILVPPGTYSYTRLTQELTVGQGVTKIKLAISYKGASGSFLVDNVQMLNDSTP